MATTLKYKEVMIRKEDFDNWTDLVAQQLFHVYKTDLDDEFGVRIDQAIVVRMIANNIEVLKFKTLKELLVLFDVLDEITIFTEKYTISMTEDINNISNHEITISCAKCKQLEDTFTMDEKPEDYGWFKKGSKWYCDGCSQKIKK